MRRAGPATRGRRAIGTGMGLFLLAAGAILLFAVPAGSPLGLNLHVVGGIVIGVGVLGLVLPSVRRGPSTGDWLSRWVNPSGINDPSVHDVQSAASADVAQITEGDKYFRPDGPGRQPDEL